MTVAALRPEVVDQPVVILLQQGIALYRQGDMAGAEDVFTRVLLDDPGNPHALHLLGLIVHKRGDHEMAETLLTRALTLHPHSRVASNLGVLQQQQGRLDAAIATYRQALRLEPDYLEAATNLLFALDLHPHATPELLLAERRAFAEAFCDPLTAQAEPHANDRDPDRRLRIGYVSPDFRHHSAATSFRWITAHDPSAVETYLYSTASVHDDMSGPFRAAADVWCEVGDLGDAELAAVIREDAIDILVDLAGISQGGRPLLFALKPAPIQVVGWGYGAGTGMQAFDYLVGDDTATPPDHADRYREQILRLPCLLAYAPGVYPELSDGSPQKRHGYRMYGYLGRAQKVTEPTLAVWAEILRRDPTSRLLLKHGQWEVRGQRDRVAHALWALGVPPERVEVRGQTARVEHLAAYNEVDVALDTFPQTGGVTVADACLMGVPTVTLLGETVQGRVTASILKAILADGLVASTTDEYVSRALRGVAPRVRRVLRSSLLTSILCQPRAYAQACEAAYYRIWQRWCSEAAS